MTDPDIESIRALRSALKNAEERNSLHVKMLAACQHEVERLKAALERIEGCHRTFEGGTKDIRGQHCRDLERIARSALKPELTDD